MKAENIWRKMNYFEISTFKGDIWVGLIVFSIALWYHKRHFNNDMKWEPMSNHFNTIVPKVVIFIRCNWHNSHNFMLKTKWNGQLFSVSVLSFEGQEAIWPFEGLKHWPQMNKVKFRFLFPTSVQRVTRQGCANCFRFYSAGPPFNVIIQRTRVYILRRCRISQRLGGVEYRRTIPLLDCWIGQIPPKSENVLNLTYSRDGKLPEIDNEIPNFNSLSPLSITSTSFADKASSSPRKSQVVPPWLDLLTSITLGRDTQFRKQTEPLRFLDQRRWYSDDRTSEVDTAAYLFRWV